MVIYLYVVALPAYSRVVVDWVLDRKLLISYHSNKGAVLVSILLESIIV